MGAARPTLVRAVHGVRETQDFARELARACGPGAFYALEGDLGAGKTCFVQGLCDGLGLRDSLLDISGRFDLCMSDRNGCDQCKCE